MSKMKKAFITALVFIIVGISGSIISGFYIMPQIVEEVYRVQREIRNATPTESEIFVTEEVVNTLDIEVLDQRGFDVEVKSSTDNKTRITVYEYLDESINVNADYHREDKRLIITGSRTIQHILNAENLKGFLERGYKALIGTLMEESNNTNQIVIEVPTGVDINFKGNYNNNLIINESSVLKENLSYSCHNGYVDLPFNNNLKNIDIKTDSYLEMDIREFINADKVNLESAAISIVSAGYRNEYENITKLPESVTIYGNSVRVTSFMPLGKDVAISGNYVEYESNFEVYPINLQLRGRAGAESYYNNGMNNNFHGSKVSENFQGIIGSEGTSENNLTISRYYKCEIDNLSDFEIETEFK